MPFGGEGWDQHPLTFDQAVEAANNHQQDGVGLMPRHANEALREAGLKDHWLVLLDFDGITEENDATVASLLQIGGVYAERSPSRAGVRVIGYATHEWVSTHMARGRRNMMHPVTHQHCGELFVGSGYTTITGWVLSDGPADFPVLDGLLDNMVLAIDPPAAPASAEVIPLHPAAPLELDGLTAVEAQVVRGELVAGQDISETVFAALTTLATQCTSGDDLAARAWVTGRWADSYWLAKRDGSSAAAWQLASSDAKRAFEQHVRTRPAPASFDASMLPGATPAGPTLFRRRALHDIEPLEPPALLIPGVVHERVELMLVYGAAASGKSWFTYEMAASLTGLYNDFGGVRAHRQTPRRSLMFIGESLYLATERLRHMCSAPGRDDRMIEVVDQGCHFATRGRDLDFSMAAQRAVEATFDTLLDGGAPGLCVIENLGDYYGNESMYNAQDVRDWLNWWRRLTHPRGMTLVVEHHVPKDNALSPSGSHALLDAPDVAVQVSPHADTGFTLTYTKNKHAARAADFNQTLLYDAVDGGLPFIRHPGATEAPVHQPIDPAFFEYADTPLGLVLTEKRLLLTVEHLLSSRTSTNKIGYRAVLECYEQAPLMRPVDAARARPPLDSGMFHPRRGGQLYNTSLGHALRRLVTEGFIEVCHERVDAVPTAKEPQAHRITTLHMDRWHSNERLAHWCYTLQKNLDALIGKPPKE